MHSAADGARRETVLFFSPLNAIKWRLGRREEEGGVRPSPSLHEKRAVLQPSRPFGQARSYAALKETKLSAYEIEDEADILKNFEEFTLVHSLYWAIAEGCASEMAAKRTAMENATKNAREMITKLTLTYNRSHQAAITNELIDIITSASSLN